MAQPDQDANTEHTDQSGSEDRYGQYWAYWANWSSQEAALYIGVGFSLLDTDP